MVDFWIFMALLVLLAIVLGIPIVLVMLVGVRKRLNHLENTVETILWQRHNTDKVQPAPTPVEPVKPAPPPDIQSIEEIQSLAQTVSVPKTETPHSPPPLPEPPVLSGEEQLLAQLKAMYESDKPSDTPKSASAATVSAPQLSVFERLERWFIGGNVPVNVGIVVLLAGVAALIKYATDQGLLSLSIELRLSAISLTALGALVFAWNKRQSHRVFSLSMQGGAIGILLLVVFSAYKLYRLLPANVAFALSVGLIAGLSVLAVLQYSRSLAVLGILAGFLAPIWLSDGRGNHIGLFTWYALVNAGIFAMAWLRPWRALNILGFAFTWGIGTVWGVLQYNTEKFASSQAFLLLFFVFYLLLPLLYARRAEPVNRGQVRIDGTLVFGTPLVAFSLQSGLLAERWPLALCALALALVYLALAYALNSRARRWQHLSQAYSILAVGFATLAVPLALSAQATASVFALEGAGLVWLGLTQHNRLAHWSGIGLQLAAAFSWILGLDSVSIQHFSVITNAMCISGVLIALSGFVIAWLYSQHDDFRPLAVMPYLWGLVWWLGIWAREITVYKAFHSHHYDQPWRFELNALLLLFGFSAWLAALIQRRITMGKPNTQALALAIKVLSGTVLFCLLLAFVMALAQYGASPCGNVLAEKLTRSGLNCASPASGVINGGTWVWLLFALLGLHSLYLLRHIQSTLPSHSQLIWLLLWASVWMLEVSSRQWIDGWYGLMLALPWLVLVSLSTYRWHWLRWPLGVRFDPFRNYVQIIGLTVLGLWWLIWLFNAGNSAPLTWIVVFNPLDLAQIAALLLLALCLHHANVRLPVPLALAALVLISVMTLRAVHHWGHVPWRHDHLLASGLTQTSLTVVWSLLGMAGWIIGSKRGLWGLWLSGLLLMLGVLCKLLLVDRSNLGDLLGISAFIIYGVLCIVVGGLAPAPPRRPKPEGEQS